MPAVLPRFQWQVLATPVAGCREPTDLPWIGMTGKTLTALLIDGHGQGRPALAASRTALVAARANLDLPVPALFGRVHHRLAGTPGVSLVLARISPGEGRLDFAGTGRIQAVLVGPSGVTPLASTPGILGVGRPVVPRALVLPSTSGCLLVLAGDGLVDRWDLGPLVSSAGCRPAEVIRRLIRPFGRMPDDVSLIVVSGS